MRTSSLQLFVLTVGIVVVGCSGTGTTSTPPGGGGGADNTLGGTTSDVGGSSATGGSISNSTGGSISPTGGAMGTGGAPTGGLAATGGRATGGAPAATGGSPPTATGGMVPATGGSPPKATGGMMPATGGSPPVATGGMLTFGGSKATGGAVNGGAKATGGSTAAGGGSAVAAGGGPDCSTPMPTGGVDHTGTNVNGTADGLNYGIWTNGSGGTITVFSNAHAFATSWNNSQDFLAHLGLDFNGSKAATAYTSIVAQFVETKSATGVPWSSIGMYGWMHSPCIEWYINEDSFGGMGGSGATATIDGATYYLTTTTTTGTGGANACESGHTGGWTQIHSTRKTARQCGTITVSDHFAAWAAQGWSLGGLTSVHINVEVGGGNGSIQFPVANVTAN